MEYLKPILGTYWPQRDETCAFVPDDNIEMYLIIHAFNSNGTRKGLVTSLQDVWKPVELIIYVFERHILLIGHMKIAWNLPHNST